MDVAAEYPDPVKPGAAAQEHSTDSMHYSQATPPSYQASLTTLTRESSPVLGIISAFMLPT